MVSTPARGHEIHGVAIAHEAEPRAARHAGKRRGLGVQVELEDAVVGPDVKSPPVGGDDERPGLSGGETSREGQPGPTAVGRADDAVARRRVEVIPPDRIRDDREKPVPVVRVHADEVLPGGPEVLAAVHRSERGGVDGPVLERVEREAPNGNRRIHRLRPFLSAIGSHENGAAGPGRVRLGVVGRVHQVLAVVGARVERSEASAVDEELVDLFRQALRVQPGLSSVLASGEAHVRRRPEPSESLGIGSEGVDSAKVRAREARPVSASVVGAENGVSSGVDRRAELRVDGEDTDFSRRPRARDGDPGAAFVVGSEEAWSVDAAIRPRPDRRGNSRVDCQCRHVGKVRPARSPRPVDVLGRRRWGR